MDVLLEFYRYFCMSVGSVRGGNGGFRLLILKCKMSTRHTKKAKTLFENIKHVYETGQENWSSGELSTALEYSDYRYFEQVARKAYIACRNSGVNPVDHFVVRNEMVKIGSGAER